ncbi:hypothetical protein LUZ62_074065 [Rhynchospora pubera]|uniref:U3 small nucleolar RNA-associated protein 15 C-terminal domain-containing protein n=1 Tax=Rhynchospora pubera TaxID=906938 RepID=A0AAV8D7A5_9POAL|nr:hypothetical protein LUZ62_074065 [Rhynchospora pubera]
MMADEASRRIFPTEPASHLRPRTLSVKSLISSSFWRSFRSSTLHFSSLHRDYIRAGAPSPVSPDVFVTGSYDHAVKIWDARADSGASSVLSINHGHLVESVLFLPSGGLLATAGGNTVKIWDVIAGGKPIYSVETHNKTVTALTLAKVRDDTRLLSVSIDGYLKSFDFSRFKITHSMQYPAPLLSVAFSPTGTIRVVGTNNGAMYMGIKKKKDEFEGQIGSNDFAWSVPLPEKPTSRKNIRYFKRGQSEGDFIIRMPEKVKLKEHDRLLKKFMHKDALVSVLKTKQTTSINIMAVLEELVTRKKLINCISNLDNDELELLLSFISKKATQPWCIGVHGF